MKWKIFIITHGPIIDDYYKNDPLFSNEHYQFFNVSDIPITHEKFAVLNKSDISDFIHLGKWYAEAEAIYNIYKCNLYQEYDYIGFIHWDFELRSENPFIDSRVTETIEKIIEQKDKFISFTTFDFWDDYSQLNMMDSNFPNQLVGEGKNCYETIVEDYNRHFETQITVDYLMTKRINLCSSFMCEISVFKELMNFYCFIIESKKLDEFDVYHAYRFQGGMLERYIGCYSYYFNFAEIPLYHRWSGYIDTQSKKRFKKLKLIKKLLKSIITK